MGVNVALYTRLNTVKMAFHDYLPQVVTTMRELVGLTEFREYAAFVERIGNPENLRAIDRSLPQA